MKTPLRMGEPLSDPQQVSVKAIKHNEKFHQIKSY
jgi:hypothetical protein